MDLLGIPILPVESAVGDNFAVNKLKRIYLVQEFDIFDSFMSHSCQI